MYFRLGYSISYRHYFLQILFPIYIVLLFQPPPSLSMWFFFCICVVNRPITHEKKNTRQNKLSLHYCKREYIQRNDFHELNF